MAQHFDGDERMEEACSTLDALPYDLLNQVIIMATGVVISDEQGLRVTTTLALVCMTGLRCSTLARFGATAGLFASSSSSFSRIDIFRR